MPNETVFGTTDSDMTGDHKRLLVLMAVGGAMIVGAILWYPYTPAGIQRRNMAEAVRRRPAVVAVLESDDRYRKVRAEVYTGNLGSLIVRGVVQTDADAAALKQAIESAVPPALLTWSVKTVPTGSFEVYDDVRPARRLATQPTAR